MSRTYDEAPSRTRAKRTYAQLNDEERAQFKKYIVLLVIAGIIGLLCIIWRMSK